MSTLRPGISVVAPVRDDPDGVVALLGALVIQTRPADEVIIVNDGSVDRTREVLETHLGMPLNYRIVDACGVGIAAARNLGVSLARHELIACTDAGCVPVPEWLEAIEQASRGADFVAGVVIVDAQNLLERVLAISAFPRADELDNPSLLVRVSHRLFGRGVSADRSGGGYMAFRRSVWESVGGFPLGLPSSEDRGFNTAVARAGFRIVRAPRAGVHWRARSSLTGNLQMFFNYSRGDVRIRPRSRHVIRALAYAGAAVLLLLRRPVARLALAIAGFAYVWLPFHRAREEGLRIRHWWRIPVVIALKDLAQIAGAGVGMLDLALSQRRGRQG